MVGREINGNGLTGGEEAISHSALEREAKRAEALRVVQAVSSLAGREIPILPTPDAESIPQTPGVYLFPDYDDPENPIVDTSFQDNPHLLSGRADSAHSVLTGMLRSRTQSGELRSVAVAVKCSLKRTPEERFTRAKNELSVMSELYSKGELGFKPIALAISPEHAPMDGKLVIVSRFDGTINTMDNLPWGRGASDPANVEAAVSAASAIGRFNAQIGKVHHDAKIKNVATSSRPVKTGMIDFETSTPMDPERPFDASSAAHIDFRLLIESLADKRFFHHPRAHEVLQDMADAYLENWVMYGSDVFDEVHSMVQAIVAERIAEQRIRHPVEQFRAPVEKYARVE